MIANKVVNVVSSRQNFSDFADSSTPTAEERDQILLFGSLRDGCYQKEKAIFVAQPLMLRNVLSAAAAAQQAILADLYNGADSYGGYAKRAVAANQSANEAIAAVLTEMKKASADALARAEQISLQAQQVLDARRAAMQNHIDHVNSDRQQQKNQEREDAMRQREVNQITNAISRPISCSTFGNRTYCN